MVALELGLAGDAAWRLGGRVQAGIGDLHPAIGALAKGAGFDPAQCGIDGGQLGGLGVGARREVGATFGAGPVLVTGSLYLVGEMMKRFSKKTPARKAA